MTPDILENRIIKYTIFYLSQCRFIEDDINSKLIEYYRRLDQVELAPVYTDTFNSIAYSPLNERYRSILKLCELILRDSSLDLENIGDRNAISFTIDMNKLFEDFVANLLTERLGESNIKLQQTEFPELKGNKLKVRLDIIVLQDGKPVIILDTKYKQYEDDPDMGHIAQLALYSNTTGVKTCGLIYVGNFPNQFIHLKADIKVHILTLNLIAISKQDFELNCSQFIQDLMNLMLEIN